MEIDMELTRANLLKKFPNAEICAGSFVVKIDGVNTEVATMHQGTGEYSLTDAGSAIVYAEAEEAKVTVVTKPVKAGKAAKKGLAPAPAPVESLPLPGVDELEGDDPFGLKELADSMTEKVEEADE
jgi:hypothetical protein